MCEIYVGTSVVATVSRMELEREQFKRDAKTGSRGNQPPRSRSQGYIHGVWTHMQGQQGKVRLLEKSRDFLG